MEGLAGPKGPLYHGYGYGWENRWQVIFQDKDGGELIVDRYLTRSMAEALVDGLEHSRTSGSFFIVEMGVIHGSDRRHSGSD